ncbi:MAG: hypothetical protein ACOC21_01055 [Halanaerobiales bacterium]
MVKLTANEYFKALIEFYKYNFDLEKDKSVLEERYDLYAESRVENEQYFATRSIKIWSYNNYEYCLVKKSNKIDDKIFKRNFFKKLTSELVDPHRGHKQSYITYVQILETTLPDRIISKIKGFNYSRSFWFGFRGWCDARLIFVDLSQKEVYTSHKANEVRKYYLPQNVVKKDY